MNEVKHPKRPLLSITVSEEKCDSYDKEKMIVSYHGIGQAIAAAKKTNSAPVQKRTIVTRTFGTPGYAMQEDECNHYRRIVFGYFEFLNQQEQGINRERNAAEIKAA